jgi:putative tricarboxylic transport membrane protein
MTGRKLSGTSDTMHDTHQPSEQRSVVSTRTMEIVVAALFMAAGGVVMMDSLRVGAGWVDPDGPQAGYFPMRMGAIMAISSLVVLVQAVLARGRSKSFVDRHALKQVLLVLLPAAVYVAAVNLIGMYVSSAVFIAAFMMFMGGYKWHISAAIGLGVAVMLFMMFEIWFLVPLPKGPFEELLG